jgi:predicted transcriptional regulator
LVTEDSPAADTDVMVCLSTGAVGTGGRVGIGEILEVLIGENYKNRRNIPGKYPALARDHAQEWSNFVTKSGRKFS